MNKTNEKETNESMELLYLQDELVDIGDEMFKVFEEKIKLKLQKIFDKMDELGIRHEAVRGAFIDDTLQILGIRIECKASIMAMYMKKDLI